MNHLQKQYQTLVLAENDLSLAQEFATVILDKQYYDQNKLRRGFQDTLQKSLNISFVIIYSRPFLNNKGLNRFPERLLKSLNEDEKSSHLKILDYRNKLFAHSDASNYSGDLVYFNGDFRPTYTSKKEIWFGLQKSVLLSSLSTIGSIRFSIKDEMDFLKTKIIK